MPDYDFTQQSGANFKVSAADKADALEDTNEVRQIVTDLGDLLGHSRKDGSYPANLTEGGVLAYAESAKIITGGEISLGSSGATFKVAALTAALRESSGDTATLKYQTLAEQDNETITAADTTYNVLLTYSTGDPAISISETVANGNNVIGIGYVRKTTGDEVHFANSGRKLQDGIGKLHKRAADLRLIELANGCTLSYAGTNNLGIAEGVIYEGINRFTPFSTGAFTTTGTDVFTYVGRASTGADDWFYTTGATDIDYAHYDNSTTGLDTIGVGRYGCHWVYLHPDEEHVYVVYGRDSYKLAEAEVAFAPTIPDVINDFGLLLGCVIAPYGGGEFTTVQMVTDTFFVGTAMATHNELGGLDTGDYQHLTSAEHDEITKWASAVTLSTGGTVNIPTGEEYQINGSEVKLDEWATPTDVTTLDATTGVHGLLPKRDGDAAHWLDGSGAWTAPTASEVGALESSGAFTVNALTQISTTGGVIKASPFLVTTGDVMDFGAHSAGFTEQQIATTTGTVAINWNSGNKALFTRSTGAAGAATFTFTAPVKSANLMLIIRGSTAGSTGTITWPTIYWQGGSVPTLTGTASAIDAVALYYSTGLTAYLGLGSANFSTV